MYLQEIIKDIQEDADFVQHTPWRLPAAFCKEQMIRYLYRHQCHHLSLQA